MKQFKSIALGGAILFLMAGCSEFYEPAPKVSGINAGTSITSTSALSHVFLHEKDSDYISCTQPPPDAAFDQGESASASLFTFTSSDGSAESESSEEVEMAGRTPAVLMARELFYRACEFSQNYKLDKQDALTLYMKTLNTVESVWATEAGNTTVSIGDTVTITGGTTVQTTKADSATSNDNIGSAANDAAEVTSSSSDEYQYDNDSGDSSY